MRRIRNLEENLGLTAYQLRRWCCLGGYALATGAAIRGAGPLLPICHLAGLADCHLLEEALVATDEKAPCGLTGSELSSIKV